MSSLLMLSFSVVRRSASLARLSARCFVDAALTRPIRGTGISPLERAALRAARKKRATKLLLEQREASESSGSGTSRANLVSLAMSRYIWYLSIGIPSALLVWGFSDANSPPAQLCRMIGLADFIRNYTDEIAKPSHNKLLPDWSQIPNVPHDIPVPHTLVLDLEKTLVNSSWDRKFGWRHAKRPGVDKFLHEMAQYYEIVLYSPSIDGIAEPVVTALDKDGCIMHRLYRDATYYTNGVHVKDLKRLNRNVKRMVVLDDDPEEVQFNLENLIRVKPYNDPTDRTDNTLERITPFLIEIAREGYSDIPTLLRQYENMDADEIADEQERRLQQLRYHRQHQRGLKSLARGPTLPKPELPPSDMYDFSAPQQLTAKDIAGAAPPSMEQQSGLVGWMQRRAKEKEEHQARKMEKWQEVMTKKQKEKEQAPGKSPSQQ